MAFVQSTTEVQDRKAAWRNLANTQIQSPDDLYQVAKPASSWQNYDFQKKRGFVEGFFQGVPEEEGYQSTFGEAMGAGLTEFVRSGVEVGMKFWSPEYKAARESIAKVRQYDPEMADQIEKSTIGKKLSNTKLAVKGAAAVGEGILTFLPMFKVGRAAIVAKEAAALTKLGKAGAFIAKNPLARNFVTGGFYSSLYSGLYGLHEQDADAKAALKYAAIGGVVGAPLVGFGGLALRATVNGATKAGNLIKTGAEVLASNVPDWIKAPNNAVMRKVYNVIFSTGSNIQRYYREIGDNFVNMYRKAVRIGSTDLGRLHLSMIENGLVEPPVIAKKFFKHVQYVGNDEKLMAEYNRILRGQSVYADPVIRAQAIEADARLTYIDTLRKWYGTKAQQSGIVENLLDLDTYLPKYTADVALSKKSVAALEKAATQAEREAIYAANDDLAKVMIETSVFDEKAFKTLEESYKAYYDYTDFALSGNRVAPNDNTFLRKMISDGQARNIEEAAGKIIEDLKFRKKTLTPLASSLDFKRKINLPWYDPNPARTLPVYLMDASMRLAMSQSFGANDEIITEMIGKIRRDPSRGAEALKDAQEFERLVRVVTGQVERSPKSERISQILRTLNVPKLAFAQILNVGQNLNYLLATDFGATFHGLQTVFREQSMRKAIESGVLLNNFMREIFEYSGGGTKFADSILKWTGFTWSEMFNRATGAVVSERWAMENFKSFLKRAGISELNENEQKVIVQMILDKKMFEKKVLDMGIEVQRQYLEAFKQTFPNDNFQAVAGNVGVARQKLAKLEGLIEPKIGKLQKAKMILEKDLLAESQPLTEQYVKDLQDAISLFKSEISQGSSPVVRLADGTVPPAPVYSDIEVQQAVEGAVLMRRTQMEQTLAKLEDKFMEIRALGTMQRDIPSFAKTLDPTSKDLGQYVASVADEIKGIDRSILGLQNELAEKSQLLGAVVDSYDIAAKRMAKEFPEGLSYDKFIDKQRTKFNKKALAEKAKILTEKNGGVTINLEGDIPETGFAFSRNKDTEFVKPMDKWTIDDIERYVDQNFDLLQDDNAFLGVWVDEGKVYTDVSTVLPDKVGALVEAKNADQLAIFDLENFNSIFVKDNEKTIIDALNKGQIEGAVEGGITPAAFQEGIIGKGRAAEGVRLAKAPSIGGKISPEEIALRELGINLDEAKLRGFLASDDLITAAQTLVERTQFMGRLIDLPAFASSPMGKVIFQFKTFVYQQMRFLSHELKRDVVNNPKRFFRTVFILGTIFPMTGEVLADIRSLVTQEKRPTRALDRYLSDLGNAGAFGLAFDFMNSVKLGRTTEFLAGVTVSDAMSWLEKVITPALSGNVDSAVTNFTKQLLRQSGVGRIGVNILFPSTRPGQTFFQDLMDWTGDE